MSQGADRDDARQSAVRANNAAVLATETLRRASTGHHHPRKGPGKDEERISVFWRVFGGTLLSIAALVAITLYNNFNSTVTDLRKDLNNQIETRVDLIKKDEFNSRLTLVWNALKEMQAGSGAVTALTERSKSLEQQLKTGEDDRKDLHRQLEEQRRAAEEERKDWTRKLEDQRKAGEEERKEYARKLEDQRKANEDERKDFSRELQKLGERLAAVEGRQAGQTAPKTASTTH
jgi:hypothetical protein